MRSALAASLIITVFVAATMLLVEYLHLLRAWRTNPQVRIGLSNEYLLAALLGASPGCLGVFAAVALYSHGGMGFAAMVVATVASCGDEAFVMLALFPKEAVLIFCGLAVWGLIVGSLVGLWVKPKSLRPDLRCLQVHPEDARLLPSFAELIAEWRACSPTRGAFALLFGGALVAVLSGMAMEGDSVWIRWTFGLATGFALCVVVTTPEHFLEQHLWRHVVKKHLPGIFLWTFGTLVAMHWLAPTPGEELLLSQQPWALLGIACAVGVLPQSGPHLVFVLLYSQGALPLSVLVASSVVQDGHGMLPLLAFSRSDFVKVKAINLAAGFSLGAIMMAFGL